MSLFSQNSFIFPYDYKFPGQGSDEFILFVTRENASMLWIRRATLFLISLSIVIISTFAYVIIASLNIYVALTVQLLGYLGALVTLAFGWWWVSTTWKKSLMMVTSQRLIKFIQTTPFNRHVLSLPLEMIVDTGSYTKGYVQAIFKLGTFTARSSAASSGVATDEPQDHRINKKYFYIENVAAYEDLQHYVNKLLQAHHYRRDELSSFRPFIPNLKGEDRKKFMEQHPGYWS